MHLHLREFTQPLILLIAFLLVGSGGYHFIEGWGFLDSLYMTLITLSTVGFGEVHKLNDEGKIFTIFLLVAGVIFYAVTINSIIKNLMEYSIGEFMKNIKTTRKISRMRNHYIICGGGRMAYAIGREMEADGKEFVFIENSQQSVVSEFSDRWTIIYRDALREESLIEAGILTAAGLASVLPTDADNLFVVLSARRLNPKLFIQTRISIDTTHSKMLQAGADRVVSPYAAGGLQIARTFLNPHIDDFLSIVIDRARYDFEVDLHNVTESDPFCNRPISDSAFRERGFIIIGVRSPDGRMKFAPEAGFVLRKGDELFLLGRGK